MASTNPKVNVPVLWDANGEFTNNEIYSISVQSEIKGTTQKPAGVTIPGYPKGNPVDTLQIKDPEFGVLYLSITLAEYLMLIGDAVGGAALSVINWTGDDQVPAGNTITSSELSGIVIFSINKGGVTIYNYNYTDGTPNGMLDLTTDGGLAPGENIQILYKRA